jgi:hypothetical protein
MSFLEVCKERLKDCDGQIKPLVYGQRPSDSTNETRPTLWVQCIHRRIGQCNDSYTVSIYPVISRRISHDRELLVAEFRCGRSSAKRSNSKVRSWNICWSRCMRVWRAHAGHGFVLSGEVPWLVTKGC